MAATISSSAPITMSSEVKLPIVLIDSRMSACAFEEQKYYKRGKAERRAAKLMADLDAQGVDYRVQRWRTDADVPDAATISAMGPKKYLRNC